MKKMFRVLVTLFVGFTFFSVGNLNIVQAAESNSLTYSNQIDSSTNHNYKISTSKEGILTITNLIPTNTATYATLIDENTGTEYESGQSLPIGDYKLLIFSDNDSLNTYKFNITGPTFTNSSSELPSLNITNPSSFSTRLAKGVLSSSLEGTTSGIVSNYILNNSDPISLSGNFSEKINLIFGRNSIDINATNDADNTVTKSREVLSPGIKRVGANSNFEAAVNISKEISSLGYRSDTVIITAEDAYIDGTIATALAFEQKAPILITNKDSIPIIIKDEIKRLKASKAIIIGGDLVIESSVETELNSLGVKEIKRISGSNRYQTATKVADEFVDENTDTALIVNQEQPVNLILAANVAAESQIPILLTTKDSLPSATETYIKENPQIKSFILIGNSTYDITDTVMNKLDSYGDVSRIDNVSRYDLSVNIYNNFFVEPTSFIVVPSDGFSFGVLSGPLAALKNYKVLFTPTDKLNIHIENYLTSNNATLENFYIVGPTISSNVSNQLNSFIK